MGRGKRSDFIAEERPTSEHNIVMRKYWVRHEEQMERQNEILADIAAKLQVIVDKMGPREPPPSV